jgi:hypothetical protein
MQNMMLGENLSGMNKLTKTIPPKKGPQPQGLNISYNTVKTIQSEKINGRHRQGSTKRRATNNIT